MVNEIDFTGFSPKVFHFYRDLALHNNRAWFEAHKQDYKGYVLAPAHDFVLALGKKLQTLSPYIGYDAQTGGRGSIHRIYRDIRFSKNKTPYKTNLGIFFWMGERRPGSVTPGFWFHLDAEGARFYAGMYEFSPEELRAFRAAVDDGRKGVGLKKMITALEKHKGYSVGGEFYKRMPGGFDPGHKRAELLRYNSLYAVSPLMKPSSVTSSKLLAECYAQCKVMYGLTEWLMKLKLASY
ncbi:MAG: DUF2461 domain-containing protein [Candidatus Firestonebacteria bacterium]|nr:DUF2461 domain-containing protein [Candidatus Firestonebacteria bacterium]